MIKPMISGKLPRKRRQQEDDLQMQCVKWFRTRLPDEMLLMIKNQGIRAPKQVALAYGQKQRRMGLLKGAADLLWIRDDHAVFIELKKPGGKLRPDQREFRDAIDKTTAHEYHVADSFKDFRALIARLDGRPEDFLEARFFKRQHQFERSGPVGDKDLGF